MDFYFCAKLNFDALTCRCLYFCVGHFPPTPPSLAPPLLYESSDHRPVSLRIKGSDQFILSVMKPAMLQRSPVARGIVGSASVGLSSVLKLDKCYYGSCLRLRADCRHN